MSCVQTVDSPGLVERLQRRLTATASTLDVFVQVNVSGEPAKSGVAPADVGPLVDAVAAASALRLRGYMTVGLNAPDLAAVRAGYAALRDLRDRLAVPGADELSMGMTGDFEAAIAEGATIVRLGSAIFGSRPAPLDRPEPPIQPERLAPRTDLPVPLNHSGHLRPTAHPLGESDALPRQSASSR